MISSRTVLPAPSEKFTSGKTELIFVPGYSQSCTTSISASAAGPREPNIELQKSDPDLALSANQIARLELRDLESAIAKLSDEQRAVILLIGLEGMGYDEVASLLNLPVGTIRSRLSRGRETLRILTGLFPNRHRRSPGLGAKARLRPAPSANRKSFQHKSAQSAQ
jgi:hypothetical protein